MGYVGLPLSILISKLYKVYGFDEDKSKILKLKGKSLILNTFLPVI